jgi:hephaestin
VEEYETPFAVGRPELANRVVHAINGWVYCNNQGLSAKAGERCVRARARPPGARQLQPPAALLPRGSQGLQGQLGRACTARGASATPCSPSHRRPLHTRARRRVRWHVASLGSEHIHTAHWHGITLTTPQGRRVDQQLLQPASIATLDSVADNPGTWLLHCHVNEHLEGGMVGLFNISGGGAAEAQGAPAAGALGLERGTPVLEPPGIGQQPVLAHKFPSHPRPWPPAVTGAVREYFIAAVQEEWDYAPAGGDMCSGALANYTEAGAALMEAGPDRIGSKYLKARFVEFMDASFATRKVPGAPPGSPLRLPPGCALLHGWRPLSHDVSRALARLPRPPPQEHPAGWEHLGLAGPLLRAQVGDTLRVTLRNLVPGHNVTLHPHGVLYTKSSEGSPYMDGTSGADKADDGVKTGAQRAGAGACL